MQLFIFLALVLDAIAIARQSGRADAWRGDAAGAYAAARRMIGWSLVGVAFALALLAVSDLLPGVQQRRRRARETHTLWPLLR